MQPDAISAEKMSVGAVSWDGAFAMLAYLGAPTPLKAALLETQSRSPRASTHPYVDSSWYRIRSIHSEATSIHQL